MILSKLFGKQEKREASLAPSRSGLGALLTMGYGTASGVNVSFEKSLTVSSVYACIRILAESVASLPLPTYERRDDGRGKERATEHHLYRILRDQPNPEMTAFEYREYSMQHLAGRGNAYSEIEYDRAGRVRALWPLNPAKMEVRRERRELTYHYTLPDGKQAVFPFWKIHHVRSMGNGIVGYSVVSLARQGIGYALATEQQDAAFYGNGAVPGVILKHPGALSDQAHSRLITGWESKHKGIDNAYRTAILEEGMEIETVGLSKKDSEFIATREFQTTEIARWFRIPPHMIGDLRRATFSNVEQQSTDFLIHTLRPWLVRIEQAISRDLIDPAERERIFAEHLVDGLLRGDIESRYQAYQTGRQGGWLSANDIREFENMNPIDGGDEYLVPLNMVPAGTQPHPSPPQGEGTDEGDEDRNLAPPQPFPRGGGCTCDGVTDSRRSETRADEDDEPEDVRQIRTQRQRLARSYVQLFEEVAMRVVRRETNDVRGAVAKHLRKRSMADFLEWVTAFYRDFDEVIVDAFRALMLTYGDQVLGSVADELGEDEDGLTDELREFIEQYLEAFAAGWAASSRRQIEALAAGDDEEAAAAIEERLEGWRDTQPAKVGRQQAFSGLNALAYSIYGAYEVIRYRWAASGDSCAFCESVNGKIVERGEYFVEGGTSIDAGDGSTPMKVRRSKRYGPLHGGCDCVVIAG